MRLSVHGCAGSVFPFVSQVRIGAVKAAIWRNEVEKGPRYNVTFQRLYKDGDQWKSSESFGRDDLLLLAKVADQAHTHILDLQEIDRAFEEHG
jgi:hypothetical protein